MKRQKNGTWKLTDEEMNFVAICAGEAYYNLRRQGCDSIAREAKDLDNLIYKTLEAAGYYK